MRVIHRLFLLVEDSMPADLLQENMTDALQSLAMDYAAA